VHNIKSKSILISWRETILGTIALLSILFVYLIFPSNYGPGFLPFLQTITKEFFLLFLTPLLFVRFILKKSFQEYGFSLKNKHRGFIYAGSALVFSLILSYILIRYTDFLKFYKLEPVVIVNFWMFLLRELVFFNLILFFYEYFFKGFVLSLYSEKFLYGAIFIQALLYLIPNLVSPNNFLSSAPMAMIALIGGIVAYQTRSFFYSYFYSLAYIIILDSFVIYSLKNGL